MNRRNFFSMLAGLPFIGGAFATPKEEPQKSLFYEATLQGAKVRREVLACMTKMLRSHRERCQTYRDEIAILDEENRKLKAVNKHQNEVIVAQRGLLKMTENQQVIEWAGVDLCLPERYGAPREVLVRVSHDGKDRFGTLAVQYVRANKNITHWAEIPSPLEGLA